MISLALFIAAVLTGLACCAFVRRQLLKAAVLDEPNERSLHKAPVPRGGGLGLWLAFFIVSSFYVFYTKTDITHTHIFIGMGILALMLISWLDDKKSLSPFIRFSVHMATVSMGLLTLSDQQLIFQGWLPVWADRTLTGFAWLWFINLYNFMDGIDGITGTQTLYLCAGFIIVTVLTSIALTLTPMALILAGVALGFLILNWHPAKLFLGDVGSIPLGYVTGYLMIMLAVHGQLGTALALPLYYAADASITLIRRMLAGKKFWQAHREHYYQKAALATMRHDHVVWPMIIANAGLLALCVASLYAGWAVLCAAPLLVLGLLWYLKKLATQK